MKRQHNPIDHRTSGTRRWSLLITGICAATSASFHSACTTATRDSASAIGHPVTRGHSSSEEGHSRNPVIFLHGTMGSQLRDRESGRVVWGEFSKAAGNDYLPVAIRGMALPMRRGQPLSALHDTTVAGANMNKLTLTVAGIRVRLKFFGNAIERFRSACDPLPGHGKPQAQPGSRFLDFTYDWRRSSDENAVLLARFVKAKKAEFIQQGGCSKGLKFDFLAHSQGALILHYYLRYGDQLLAPDGSLPRLTWAGAHTAERVAVVGVPYAGIPEVLQYLTHGHRARPFFPMFDPAVVGTMPSVYQMLPRARDRLLIDPETKVPLDPLDINLWVQKKWGLANPDQDDVLQVLLPGVANASGRRAIALDHLRKCLGKAAQLQAALDRPTRAPRHLHFATYAGDCKNTPTAFLATPGEPELSRVTRGDGMIPLFSALRSTSERRELFDCGHHALICKKKVNEHVISFLAGEE